MFAKFYIGIRPQTNEYHTVHKEGCPFLPTAGKRIYLGIFKSSFDAVCAGMRHFSKSNKCLFCSKELHSIESQEILSELSVSGDLLSSDKLKDRWDSALQCSAN